MEGFEPSFSTTNYVSPRYKLGTVHHYVFLWTMMEFNHLALLWPAWVVALREPSAYTCYRPFIFVGLEGFEPTFSTPLQVIHLIRMVWVQADNKLFNQWQRGIEPPNYQHHHYPKYYAVLNCLWNCHWVNINVVHTESLLRFLVGHLQNYLFCLKYSMQL